MRKEDAIAVLGGTVKAAAEQIGVSVQAVYLWPEELTPALRDRVQAALYRKKVEQQASTFSTSPACAIPPEQPGSQD